MSLGVRDRLREAGRLRSAGDRDLDLEADRRLSASSPFLSSLDLDLPPRSSSPDLERVRPRGEDLSRLGDLDLDLDLERDFVRER